MSSVYLEAVAATREQREKAELAFRAALQVAAQHHSLATIAPHAGLSKSGVVWLVKAQQK